MIDPRTPVYRTKDIAQALGVTQEYVRQQVRDGKLHATVERLSRLRRVYRFSLNDVVAYDADLGSRLSQPSQRTR